MQLLTERKGIDDVYYRLKKMAGSSIQEVEGQWLKAIAREKIEDRTQPFLMEAIFNGGY